MGKHFKYLKYVLKHKWHVFIKACDLGIPWRGIVHDLGKFRLSEWNPYVDYFYGEYLHPFRAPFYKALRQHKFDEAWLHHQKRNKHHWQYWVLTKDDGTTQALEMPNNYMKEMLADWAGVGKDNTADWYIKNRTKIILHYKTRYWIERQLDIDINIGLIDYQKVIARVAATKTDGIVRRNLRFVHKHIEANPGIKYDKVMQYIDELMPIDVGGSNVEVVATLEFLKQELKKEKKNG